MFGKIPEIIIYTYFSRDVLNKYLHKYPMSSKSDQFFNPAEHLVFHQDKEGNMIGGGYKVNNMLYQHKMPLFVSYNEASMTGGGGGGRRPPRSPLPLLPVSRLTLPTAGSGLSGTESMGS